MNSWSISFRQAAQVGPSFFLLSVSLPDPFCHRHPLGYTSSTQSPSSTPLSCPLCSLFTYIQALRLRTHTDAITDRIPSYTPTEGNNDQPRIRSLTRISGCCAPNNLQSFTHFSHTRLHWANPAASPLPVLRLL